MYHMISKHQNNAHTFVRHWYSNRMSGKKKCANDLMLIVFRNLLWKNTSTQYRNTSKCLQFKMFLCMSTLETELYKKSR